MTGVVVPCLIGSADGSAYGEKWVVGGTGGTGLTNAGDEVISGGTGAAVVVPDLVAAAEGGAGVDVYVVDCAGGTGLAGA